MGAHSFVPNVVKTFLFDIPGNLRGGTLVFLRAEEAATCEGRSGFIPYFDFSVFSNHSKEKLHGIESTSHSINCSFDDTHQGKSK